MKKIMWLIILITIAVSLVPIVVLADTTAVVTVYNTPPNSSQGITSFTVAYINDNQMDLNWTVDTTVQNVMVRAKYGSYPNNIPDENTQPTDGRLVYYGINLSAVDTVVDMNFNNTADISDTSDTPFTVYYTAWAQRFDGTWYIKMNSSSKESREVVLIGMIALGAIGSIFAIYKRQLLFAVGAAAVWFLLISYTRVNPLPNVVAGSGTDSLWIGTCVAFSLGTILTTFVMRNNDEKEKQEKYRNSNDYRSEQDVNRYNSRGSSYESAAEYQARLQRMSRKKRD
jgi:hypothetical protein